MDIFENKIEINFTNSVSANKAKEIACKVLTTFQDDTFYRNSIQETISRLIVDGNTLVHSDSDDGYLVCEDFMKIMPVMLKAIAEELSTENFTFDLIGYDTYSEGYFEGKFENGTLEMKSTYYPCGYTEELCCPECGEPIVSIDDYDPNEKYYCPECDEEVDLSEEYNELAPIIETKILKIA